MINDLVELMQKKMRNVILDIDGIKRLFRTYITYYFENELDKMVDYLL